MIRTRVYICPIDLGEVETTSPEHYHRILRYCQLEGLGRVSIVERGGPNDRMTPAPDEAMYILPVGGRWPQPAEERFGRRIRGVQPIIEFVPEPVTTT